jgi:hypothetical protein
MRSNVARASAIGGLPPSCSHQLPLFTTWPLVRLTTNAGGSQCGAVDGLRDKLSSPWSKPRAHSCTSIRRSC